MFASNIDLQFQEESGALPEKETATKNVEHDHDSSLQRIVEEPVQELWNDRPQEPQNGHEGQCQVPAEH